MAGLSCSQKANRLKNVQLSCKINIICKAGTSITTTGVIELYESATLHFICTLLEDQVNSEWIDIQQYCKGIDKTLSYVQVVSVFYSVGIEFLTSRYYRKHQLELFRIYTGFRKVTHLNISMFLVVHIYKLSLLARDR